MGRTLRGLPDFAWSGRVPCLDALGAMVPLNSNMLRPLLIAIALVALCGLCCASGATNDAIAGVASGDHSPPTVCQGMPSPVPEALRRTDSTSGGIDPRLVKLSVSLVWRGGPLPSALPGAPRSPAPRRANSSPASLQVLFCTWQA
jgi:hypothetical protein